MACSGCAQARSQFAHSVRHGNWKGAASAVATAANINIDKLRGVDVEKKYGPGGRIQARPATPYRRTP